MKALLIFLKMFVYLDTNDQAAIISMFPEEKQKEILKKIEVEDLEDVEEIMSYPDDSAGSIMTKETFHSQSKYND